MSIVVIIDLVPKFKEWIKRIHIGRYTDKKKWNEEISKKGALWLVKTPKIKVTDNTRLILLDMVKGNYSKNNIQYWQEASLLLGMTEYINNNKAPDAVKNVFGLLKRKFDQHGDWREKPETVDAAILAYALMKVNFINIDNYKKALDEIWELIKGHIGDDGTVQYRRSMKNYRYVDTIGFICPFLVCYGLRYKNNKCIDLAVRQIKMYEKYGMLNDFQIPYHAYHTKNKLPLGINGWGRGLGWYAIGLIDTWNELPNGTAYKEEMEKSVREFARVILTYQQQNGSWTWTIIRDESNPDSSATATLAWFLLNASKIKDISTQCKKGLNMSLDYLMKVTRKNGEVDFSQGDTKDIGVYSGLFTILPFTQGFCIRTVNKDVF
ncbi:glycoside hydrolase family 88 protein [Halobacillus sp. BBL2006]|uniref:glycoside hydrolase family 88 protein n=1 Tax=Halobacillus sp. BBL2006 TaxID=1543706 RepID=UPI001E4FF9BC|nr:glycoside hydrolase family 88 protein [Halobacillus sp. BBL2006]